MTEVELRSGEAIEPLDDVHSVIQSADGYRFGSDAVALAKFACGYIADGARVFDLCSGCGVVGLIVGIEKRACIAGAELDAELCDMSNRSAAMNGLDAVFSNADVRIGGGVFERGAFDAVVCNPPFYKAESKPRRVAPTANSELTVTFRDVVMRAAELLKDGGVFCFVHTAARLDELLAECNAHRLAPKNIVVNPNGKTFLCRAVKGGRQGLAVEVKEF